MKCIDAICENLAIKMGPDNKRTEYVKAGLLYGIGLVKDEMTDESTGEVDRFVCERVRADLEKEFL